MTQATDPQRALSVCEQLWADVPDATHGNYDAETFRVRTGRVWANLIAEALAAVRAEHAAELQHWRNAADDHGHADAHSWSLATDEQAARIATLEQALLELLASSGDPNAVTGEYDTAAGRARHILGASHDVSCRFCAERDHD